MKPVCLEVPQEEKLPQWETHASQQRVAPAHGKWEKARATMKTQPSQK